MVRTVPPFASALAKRPREHHDAAGAEALAKKLAEIWHDAGWPHAQFFTEKVYPRGGAMIYAVRSNLVGGLPPEEVLAKKASRRRPGPATLKRRRAG